MTRDEWLVEFAGRAGVASPTGDEIEALLALAGIAAHASERTAAPLTCWIAARAGLSAEHALELARQIEAGEDASAS